ncbi:MAG: lipid II flippase MurJ [Actinomycetota bacterium]
MTTAARTSRAAAGMGAIAAISRAIGFVRVLVIAAVLGTTYLGNAFQAANSLSNVLFELLAAGALSAVLVPAFVDLLDSGDERGAEEVAGGLLGVAMIILGLVAAGGVLAAPLLARALTLGVPSEIAVEQRELTAFLVRFFVPQVVLYAAGAIATAVLHARRRFAIAAAAPIGNTIVMVSCLLAFRAAVGADPGVELSADGRWWLVAAGSGGVVAFVGVLLLACRSTGFRLRPRLPRGDARVWAVMRHSGWGIVLHTGAGLLLGGAIFAGSAVEGGVVAYQVAWVFFLAPYAVLAQPIHSAILPELVAEAREGDLVRFRASIKWSLERMALLVLPVSAAMAALALPAMRAVSFGAVGADGPGLLAAALAMLALGLLPYGATMLLARAYYALGDSRTPGLSSLAGAAFGLVIMGVGAVLTDGWARVAVLGAAHSAAHLLSCTHLFVGLTRRVRGGLWPTGLGAIVATAACVGVAAWLAGRALLAGEAGRLADLVGVSTISIAVAAVIASAYRVLGMSGRLTRRIAGAASDPSEVSW